MKKGASHVDWVISFAIFFIYLVLLFVFIRPTHRPFYSGDALLNIVRTNFENDTDFMITKTPLFIDCSACAGQPEEEVIVEWPFTFQDICLKRSDTGLFVDNNIVSNELKIRTEFTQAKNTLYILYSDESTVVCVEEDANCGGPGAPEGECVPTPLDDAPGDNYDYGLSEYIRGISLDKIDYLNNTLGYDKLKELWHFPDKKDFAIFVYNVNQEFYTDGRYYNINQKGYDKIVDYSEDVEIFVASSFKI